MPCPGHAHATFTNIFVMKTIIQCHKKKSKQLQKFERNKKRRGETKIESEEMDSSDPGSHHLIRRRGIENALGQ
jgi:hypothetical protein